MLPSIRVSQWSCTLLDPTDYERAKAFHWHKTANGYVAGSVVEQDVRQRVYLHRWLLDAPPGLLVDHINGDKLDNRRSNLRLVTRSQNQANRRPNRTSRSRYKGVTIHKHKKLWMARIQVEGKRIHLGYFAHESLAARAYNEAARHHFGAYARTNLLSGK